MRLNIILLFITLSTFLIASINSQYILFEEFLYQGDCASLDDPSSSSEAPITCDGDTLIRGELYKEGECLSYTSNEGPSILSVSNNSLTQSIFNGSDTFCQGTVVNTIVTELNICQWNCDPDSPYGQTFKVSQIETIDIPDNTMVTVWYSGSCDGEFKERTVSIFFDVLNRCDIAPSVDLVSSITTCNSTTSIAMAYPHGVKACTGEPVYVNTLPIANVCGEDYNMNLLQICNINGLL